MYFLERRKQKEILEEMKSPEGSIENIYMKRRKIFSKCGKTRLLSKES